MPDEITPGQSGQGGAEAPAGSGEGNFNFERGYNELRPEYTRATQELGSTRERLSEYEQLFDALHDSDPEVQSAAMEALGLEMETGSPAGAKTDEFVDPLEEAVERLTQEVTDLRSARELEASEREGQRVTDMRDDYIGEAIGYIEQNLNFTFNEREEEALGNLAIAMEDESGVPNVQAAYNLLYGDKGVLESNRERWIASKTGAAVPPAGTTVPTDQKPQTRRERIAYIDERMAAMERQQ